MKREIKHLFGSRVALQLVEEEYPGLIVPASTMERVYVLSRVIAVGDQVAQNIKVGDILFWQTNGIIQKQCRYDLNGVATFILHTGDMIARLKSRTVTREQFECIGDWCLLKRVVTQPSKLIVVPDEAVETNQEVTVKFVLEAKGDTVDKWQDAPERALPAGAEVAVDRARANHIKLGEDHYYYIHKNFVLGTIG